MSARADEAREALDTDLELIKASVLPSEQVTSSDTEMWPRQIVITSPESGTTIQVQVDESYPKPSAVTVDVKKSDTDREEALWWRTWASERLEEWKQEPEPSLYELLTTHFLPLLAGAEEDDVFKPPSPTSDANEEKRSAPHHVLLSSHHLIAPSKRKDLHTLSKDLSLIGFAKVGHPGIMYATGDRDDLVEWLREVKSWQWLALRVRIGVEPVPADFVQNVKALKKGSEDGARSGKGRGEWEEVEKIGEALEWLRKLGREKLLLDLGMGAGPA